MTSLADGSSPWGPLSLVAAFLFLLLPGIATASPQAKQLYDDLLRRSDYNRLIRPVGNTTDKLTVKLGLRLTQIIDVVRSHVTRYAWLNSHDVPLLRMS